MRPLSNVNFTKLYGTVGCKKTGNCQNKIDTSLQFFSVWNRNLLRRDTAELSIDSRTV